MLKEKWYVKSLLMLQHLKWPLNVRNKKIKSTTSCISGKTEANAVVKLINAKGKVIKKAKADNKGKFTLKKLNLKKYKGKKISLKMYMLYDDRIENDCWYLLLAERTIKVR